eukprot:537927-Pelagomonas_calceolata.AAC.1
MCNVSILGWESKSVMRPTSRLKSRGLAYHISVGNHGDLMCAILTVDITELSSRLPVDVYT